MEITLPIIEILQENHNIPTVNMAFQRRSLIFLEEMELQNIEERLSSSYSSSQSKRCKSSTCKNCKLFSIPYKEGRMLHTICPHCSTAICISSIEHDGIWMLMKCRKCNLCFKISPNIKRNHVEITAIPPHNPHIPIPFDFMGLAPELHLLILQSINSPREVLKVRSSSKYLKSLVDMHRSLIPLLSDWKPKDLSTTKKMWKYFCKRIKMKKSKHSLTQP